MWFVRQREEDHQLALANHRLGSVNLLLGVANYSRNQYLAKEQDAIKERIKEGRCVTPCVILGLIDGKCGGFHNDSNKRLFGIVVCGFLKHVGTSVYLMVIFKEACVL